MRRFLVDPTYIRLNEYSTAAEAIRASASGIDANLSGKVSQMIAGDRLVDYRCSERQFDFFLSSGLVLRLMANSPSVDWSILGSHAARRVEEIGRSDAMIVEWPGGDSYVVDHAPIIGVRIGDTIRFVDFGNNVAVIHFNKADAVMFHSFFDSISRTFFLSYDEI